ncbi:hypothetical protein [Aeromicrobium sp.]|uniref:hypothetical protein n=1 Tax=Aeromicrobium sp. TaxID=1871063 RepID=UPI0030BBC766
MRYFTCQVLAGTGRSRTLPVTTRLPSTSPGADVAMSAGMAKKGSFSGMGGGAADAGDGRATVAIATVATRRLAAHALTRHTGAGRDITE